jgi:hypothetical protein
MPPLPGEYTVGHQKMSIPPPHIMPPPQSQQALMIPPPPGLFLINILHIFLAIVFIYKMF